MTSCQDWPQADEFMSNLRCGMSVAEVRAKATSSGATSFLSSDRASVLYGTHVAGEGSKNVYLGFTDGRLRWARTGALAGPWTGVRIGLKRDLCSGREFASLVIHGAPGWEGATVKVNGAIVGSLSTGNVALLETDVPFGRSELQVSTPRSTYRKILSFDHESQGVVQIDVPQ